MAKQKAEVHAFITGDRALDRTLQTLGTNVTNKVARTALRKVAKPVQKAAQRNAPVDDATLRKSIVIRAAKRSRRLKGLVAVSVMTDPKKLQGGDSETTFQPWFVEFGTPKHLVYGKAMVPIPPRPFLRPALDQARSEVLQTWKSEIMSAIDKEAKKALAKAAKGI